VGNAVTHLSSHDISWFGEFCNVEGGFRLAWWKVGRECAVALRASLNVDESANFQLEERVLLLALLDRCVRDLKGSVVNSLDKQKYHREARIWFEDWEENLKGGFSFIDCCDYLNITGEVFVRELRAMELM